MKHLKTFEENSTPSFSIGDKFIAYSEIDVYMGAGAYVRKHEFKLPKGTIFSIKDSDSYNGTSKQTIKEANNFVIIKESGSDITPKDWGIFVPGNIGIKKTEIIEKCKKIN